MIISFDKYKQKIEEYKPEVTTKELVTQITNATLTYAGICLILLDILKLGLVLTDKTKTIFTVIAMLTILVLTFFHINWLSTDKEYYYMCRERKAQLIGMFIVFLVSHIILSILMFLHII